MATPRKLRCRVKRIIAHGDHVFSVHLAPAQPAPAFRPGQFLHLTVNEYDPSGFWPESRVFSIASAPTRRDELAICYSVRGRYTARMERELCEGREVWIKLPYGEFVIDPSRDTVLFAGGTGISAFTAFLDGLHPEHPRRVWLIYGARTPELLIQRGAVLEWIARLPRLQAVLMAESGMPGADIPAQVRPNALICRAGRTSVEAVWPLIPEALAFVYYLSGPPAMLATLAADLRGSGVAAADIRTDAWE